MSLWSLAFAVRNVFSGSRRVSKLVNKPPNRDPSCRKAKCVVLNGFGGYKKIGVVFQDVQEPGPGQVQVGVKAGGMNFADLYVRHGLLPWTKRAKFPFVMGREAAGMVEAVGRGVTSIKVGDRVACISQTGLWSEVACVDAKDCILIPPTMNFEQAAAFYTSYLTAYFSIFDFGNLRPGGRIFIHSLAGGLGWAATQLAKTVPEVNVVGSAAPFKFDCVKSNGADFPVSSFDENYIKEVLAKYPGGVDIVLDNRSGAEFHQLRKMLLPMGQIIHLGVNSAFSGEHKSISRFLKTWWGLKDISVYEIIMLNQAVAGMNLDVVREKHPHRFNEGVKAINAMFTKGLLKPRIDSTWSFDEAAYATRHLTARKNIGKVILKPIK